MVWQVSPAHCLRRLLLHSPLQRGSIHLTNCYKARRFLSSPAAPSFTSYFFHNAQWSSSRKLNAFSSQPAAPDASPSVSITGFKPVERLSPRSLLKVYSQLSKERLTILNVLTAMSGVALSPFSTTVPVLLSTAVGTAFCAASANTLNQLQEIPFDAQMARTRSRPLVRRAILPEHAAGFALVTGIAGPVILWTMVNPTTAILGAANVILYAGVYTWMKRKSVFNTWVGAVVGAVPPLMGWTACGGRLIPDDLSQIPLYLPSFMYPESLLPLESSMLDSPLAPFALFMLLFYWQFPHFNSISHLVRGSYAQAGYRMLSVVSPKKNSLVSLRHSLLLIPTCSVLIPLAGLTTWHFALTSLIPNLICARAAWKFHQTGGEKEARSVWHHYLLHLPVILGLMMVHKRGIDWLEYIGLRSTPSVEEQS
ncbi:protoheme IX farnesyltransferase [Pleurotus eryngii]|uniref:Protoheme IX farnesyltransferase, mitochondrial n=1 Tax=Pleurotus eryngii TaxID=5323 RepID=A0A9P6DDX2_PLEER|nr:protoheme IX farnesyltransferase [Pleurotus eryngii]